MELTITSALAFFILIAMSSVVFFASKKLKIPYTVFLVLVGILLVPIVNLPYLKNMFGFLDDMALTPELLFFIFLPILIFESGFNMSVRKMLDSAWAISSLAILGLIASVGVIASILYFALPLIGYHIPFSVALMFGAIISPTDPVAVLSLFKEYKVTRRLAMIFEGESLFNDGTAMALFLVLLAVVQKGFNGAETVLHGVGEFVLMIASGIVIGLGMAALFSRAVRYTKNNDFVTISLLLISAHLVFITTELINETGVMHVSSIIATTVSSLFLGNYSRNLLAPKVDEYLAKLIEHISFIANSLVFLMAGLLFASTGIDFLELWVPIVVTVLTVAFARMVAVYAITVPLNFMKLENPIPASWQKLLAWASLRGALSIIIVLIIPEDFTIAGWEHAYTPRDFLLALTIGCILATLFIKAPVIGPIMRRYGINKPDILKQAHEEDLGIYYLIAKKARLAEYANRGVFSPEAYQKHLADINKALDIMRTKREELVREHGIIVFEQSLHMAMINMEKTVLKRLFINEEMDEKTYRRILGKLKLQFEKIESAEHHEINPHLYMDRKDIFDRLVAFVEVPFSKNTQKETIEQRLEYYRAQFIMARKSVEAVEAMQQNYDEPVFLEEAYTSVIATYRAYMKGSTSKFEQISKEHADVAEGHHERLALRSLLASGNRAMYYLQHRGLVDEEMEEGIREVFHDAYHHKHTK